MGRGYSDIFFVYIGMIILVVKLFNFNIFGVFRRMNIFFFFLGGGGCADLCGYILGVTILLDNLWCDFYSQLPFYGLLR